MQLIMAMADLMFCCMPCDMSGIKQCENRQLIIVMCDYLYFVFIYCKHFFYIFFSRSWSKFRGAVYTRGRFIVRELRYIQWIISTCTFVSLYF